MAMPIAVPRRTIKSRTSRNPIRVKVGRKIRYSIPRGHRFIKDVEVEPGTYNLIIHDFVEPSEPFIHTGPALERAKRLGVRSGIQHALWLLKNQGMIPVRYRKFVLMFMGTQVRDMRDKDRLRCAAAIRFSDKAKSWVLYWRPVWYLEHYKKFVHAERVTN